MAGLGVLAAWLSYSLVYYGLNTVTGGNDSFISLLWPGRYRPTARDSGGPSSRNAVGGTGPTVGGGKARGGSGRTPTIPAGSAPRG